MENGEQDAGNCVVARMKEPVIRQMDLAAAKVCVLSNYYIRVYVIIKWMKFNVSNHCQNAFLIQMDGLDLFARKEYAVMTLAMAQIALFFVRVILKTQKCKQLVLFIMSLENDGFDKKTGHLITRVIDIC